MLKFMFIFGAVVDSAIAISWFLIASGSKIPNILNGFYGKWVRLSTGDVYWSDVHGGVDCIVGLGGNKAN